MNRIAVAGALVALLVSPIWGQATSKEDRAAVLKFGIESEVLDLVQALRQEKNSEYRAELIQTYETARNDDLKQAILLMFMELKDNGLEADAVKEIAEPDKKGNSMLLNAVSYLTELKSEQVKDTLVALTSGKNKVLALAAIRALGKLGATDKAEGLITFYKDAETDPNFKPDLIWAFGEMKAASAVDLLLQEFDENDSQPLLRRSILEALGKIADDRAWDRVTQALSDTNTDVRSAAVATLGSYKTHDTETLLASALRDAAPAVRNAAAQAAKNSLAPGLKDLLAYRVKKDPDPKVRVEALRALAAYPDGPEVVLAYLGDRKTDAVVWREALNITLDKKYSAGFDTLKAVVEADLKEKQTPLAGVIASAVLPQKDTYRALFGLILASKQVAARSTAIRAVVLGKYTEFESILKTMEAKDEDPGIKAQAKKALQDLGLEAADTPTPKK